MKTLIAYFAARTWAAIRDIASAFRMNGEMTQRTMRKVFG